MLLDPMAFVRRPYRWIKQLSAEASGRTFAAAPNFAYELTAERGLPPRARPSTCSNVVGLLNGSEPVTMSAIEKFTKAFAPYGLPATAVKPSYGMAEATLGVATYRPGRRGKRVYLDRAQLGRRARGARRAGHPRRGRPCVVRPPIPDLWAVITDADGAEVPDGAVGEIWLHGNNIGRGYFGREDETQRTFGNKLQSRLERRQPCRGRPGQQLLAGHRRPRRLPRRRAVPDRADQRPHHHRRPQPLPARHRNHGQSGIDGHPHRLRGRVLGSRRCPRHPGGTPASSSSIVAERAAGVGRADPGPIADAVRAAVSREHQIRVADVRLVAAGTIPRTTSGKLARKACRAEYLAGRFSR